MEGMVRDVRLALRALWRRKVFSGVVVATLALGIGANAAVFSVLRGVLLRPLPYDEPERLVQIHLSYPDNATLNDYLSAPSFLEFRDRPEIFESAATLYTYREVGADLTGEAAPERIRTLPVAATYFETMGTAPTIGRGFTRDEELGAGVLPRTGAAVAVLSHGLWTRKFGGDLSVVGQTIRLDDQALTVVGVMPSDFRDPIGEQADLWVPQNLDRESRWNNWGNHYLTGIGRLARGVSLQEAQRRMAAFSRQLNERVPDVEGTGVLIPLHEATVGSTRATLWVLMSAVFLVLLSACVNVANLFLARAWSRRTELAVRSALGSGRGALARHLFAETMVLSLLGGAVGVGLAAAGVELFRRAGTVALPRVAAVSVDGGVLLFSFLLALGVGLLVGIVSLVQLSDSGAAASLRSGDRGGRASARQKRLRGLLVVTEVAAALVLTVGAGVLVRSLDALSSVDLGVRSEDVLTYEVHLPPSRYEDGPSRARFYDDLFAQVEVIPGVESVGATSWLPVNGRYHSWGISLDEGEDQDWHGTDVRVIDGDYFGTLDVNVVRGRAFDPAIDHADGAPAVIVNRTVDEQLFPDVDLLGRQVSINGPGWTVVGIVEDIPYDAFGTTSPKVYLAHDQFSDNRNWAMIQTVATSVDAQTIVPRVRQALADVDPNLVLYRVETFEDKLSDATARSRATTVLLGVFSALALLLAALGIYGVLGYLVGQRRHEIGVRMALGATPRSVWGLILKEGFGLAVAGIVIGLALALVGTRWLRSIVFGVEVVHVPTLVLSAVILGLVVIVAAFSPARRATRIDPVEAFRAQ